MTCNNLVGELIRRVPDNKLNNVLVSALVDNWLRCSDKLSLLRARNSSNLWGLYSDTEPLISIYTPTFNRGSTLIERAVKSVLNQTYENFEYIIVDDGSTDHTIDLVDEIDDPRIRLVTVDRKARYRYPNKALYHWFCGPVEAANLALSLCNGKWIARIDDDDFWTSDHLEVLLRHVINEKAEFVSSDIRITDQLGSRIVRAGDDPKDPTGIGATQTWLYASYLKKLRYNIHCWRRSYFRVNDTELQLRFYRSGVKICYLPQVTAYLIPREGDSFVGSKAYLSNEERYEKFFNPT